MSQLYLVVDVMSLSLCRVKNVEFDLKIIIICLKYVDFIRKFFVVLEINFIYLLCARRECQEQRINLTQFPLFFYLITGLKLF
jgi:hypothetical protein